MTSLRNIIKLSETIFDRNKCFILTMRNGWHQAHFTSEAKVDVPFPPKRPLTAYMIYCKEKRKDLLKENPSLKTTEQMKVLAEKWSSLSDDIKKSYELTARQNTQLYGEQHKKFYESLTEEQKEELARLKAEKKESRRILRNKKVLRDSGIPKAPNTAYALFVRSESQKKISTDQQPKEFIKKVAELWKSLPKNSKKVFEKQAEEDKRRFAEEMEKWRARIVAEGNKKVLRAYEELKGRDLESGEPTQKKSSGGLKT